MVQQSNKNKQILFILQRYNYFLTPPNICAKNDRFELLLCYRWEKTVFSLREYIVFSKGKHRFL